MTGRATFVLLTSSAAVLFARGTPLMAVDVNGGEGDDESAGVDNGVGIGPVVTEWSAEWDLAAAGTNDPSEQECLQYLRRYAPPGKNVREM